MPKQVQKTLQDYLSKSKVKNPPTPLHFPSKTLSSSTSWILRGCKHPKTLSFAVDPNANEGRKNDKNCDNAATLADIDRFLFENFKSFYMNDDDEETNKRGNTCEDDEEKTGGGSMISLESPRFIDPPPDLCGSHRFFVGPGSSSSLMEEARTSITTSSEDTGSTSSTTTTNETATTRVSDEAKEAMGAEDFIAVFTYSPSPYNDFKHSMQEMIEARLHHQGRVDWEFMEELLCCYMDLNDKKSYKYILSAFVDLIGILREDSGRVPVRSQQVRSAGERRESKEEM